MEAATPPAIPPEKPVFGLFDVFLVAVAAFLILLVVQFIALGVARAVPRFAHLPIQQLAKEPLLIVPAQAVSYLFLVAFIHLLLFSRYAQGMTELIPFRRPRHWAALVGAGIALAFAIQLIDSRLPIPKQLPIDEYFKSPSEGWMMLGFGVFIAPFVEELFFRGLLYPALNRLTGAVAALVITSAAFAALHASQLAFAWAPLLSLFLVGLALTLVRARGQSVLASTVVHMAYNATLFGVILAQTGGFRYMDRLTR